MKVRSVIHSTFAIERNYPTTPERVFAAFADPVKKRRWYAEGEGSNLDEFVMDFRVGGSDRILYRIKAGAPLPEGTVIMNDTIYQDIVTNQHIVLAYRMTVGDKRISASLATMEFLPGTNGTDFIFTEQAAFFEGADGPQIREAGWRQLLERLAKELAS